MIMVEHGLMVIFTMFIVIIIIVKIMVMIMVEEGVSAFLNPVRAADNIRASLDGLQQFHNDDADNDDDDDDSDDDNININPMEVNITSKLQKKR